jgi:hypothetical protein
MANLENLKKVREAIVEFRANFHYKHIFSQAWHDAIVNKWKYNSVDAVQFGKACEILQHHETEECGTLACIAGFCYAIRPELVHKEDPYIEAISWLGLTAEESHWLLEPKAGLSTCFYRWDRRLSDMVPVEHSPYLLKYPYDAAFPGYSACEKEQGYNEALRRLDFMIEH